MGDPFLQLGQGSVGTVPISFLIFLVMAAIA
jgi:hypothetical protein